MDTNEIVNRLGLDKMGYDSGARTRVATKGRDMTGIDPASVSESSVGSLPIATDASGVSTPEGEAANLIDYSVDPSGAYRPQEDVEIGELTDKIGEVGKRKQATVDDMHRAQAVESIMSNMIKAFAAYRGFKTGTDMSGVDVKTGIDWNAALQGKLGVLSDETDELKGQRVQKYRDLAARVSSAKEQRGLEMSEAERGNREALDLWRLQEGVKSRQTQESFERERLGMAKDKKADDFKAQLGGTISTYTNKINRTQSDISRLEKLPVETLKGVAGSEGAVNELKGRLVRDLGYNTKEVADMDHTQLQAAQNQLITKQKRVLKSNEYIADLATQVQQAPSQEGLNRIQLMQQLGAERVDTDVPEGSAVIPKDIMWKKLMQNPEERKRIIDAHKGMLSDPDWVNKLEDGDELSASEINKLPETAVREEIRPIANNEMLIQLVKKYPNVRIGVK